MTHPIPCLESSSTLSHMHMSSVKTVIYVPSMTIFQNKKTKAFCFINQNSLDKLRYSLVFTKSRMFLCEANFRGLTAGFARLLTLSRTLIAGYICLTKNIAIPNTFIFHFSFLFCDRETHFRRCPILLSPPSNNKHSVDLPCTEDIPLNAKHSVDLYHVLMTYHRTPNTVLISTMHSHPCHAMSPCICNARCHYMLYHVTCIMNATWTTQSTPLTGVMDNHITCI